VNRQNPDRGVTVVDYGVMIGLIAFVVIVAVVAVGIFGT
jgi:Flp pilus assembly pilin Flp